MHFWNEILLYSIAIGSAFLVIDSKDSSLNTVLVTTKNGQFEGFLVKANRKSPEAYSSVFLGIPYAEAPIGKLRFKVFFLSILFCNF